MDHEHQQAIIHVLLDQGVLAGPDLFHIDSLDKDALLRLVQGHDLIDQSFLVLTKDTYQVLLQSQELPHSFDIDWLEFDGSRVLLEKKRNIKPYRAFLDTLSVRSDLATSSSLPSPGCIMPIASPTRDETENKPLRGDIFIAKSYDEPSKKRGVKDFVFY